MDPDGRDWYSINKKIEIGDDDEYQDLTTYVWTNATSQSELDALGIDGTYIGQAVVIFEGFYDEKLGLDGKLTGDMAKSANVTIYGVNGPNDINSYLGLSVSSDPNKYSMIQDGEYRLFHEQMSTSIYGKGSLTYRISNVDGSLKLLPSGGINKYNGKTYMEAIFLHRTDFDGTARKSSAGCLVIDGRSWGMVESQLSKSNNIYLKLFRK